MKRPDDVLLTEEDFAEEEWSAARAKKPFGKVTSKFAPMADLDEAFQIGVWVPAGHFGDGNYWTRDLNHKD